MSFISHDVRRLHLRAATTGPRRRRAPLKVLALKLATSNGSNHLYKYCIKLLVFTSIPVNCTKTVRRWSYDPFVSSFGEPQWNKFVRTVVFMQQTLRTDGAIRLWLHRDLDSHIIITYIQKCKSYVLILKLCLRSYVSAGRSQRLRHVGSTLRHYFNIVRHSNGSVTVSQLKSLTIINSSTG